MAGKTKVPDDQIVQANTMAEFALVVVVVSLILITFVSRRRHAAWPGNLHRLHAGVQHRAEWMAPDEVVRAVEADYLAAHNWTADATLSGSGSIAGGR